MSSPSLEEIDAIRKSGFRPQVVGCFLNGKKILFLFKKEHNLWQLPQGGIDNRETVEQAVSREMSEELGKEFVGAAKINSVVGENQVAFPGHTKGSRELKTDDGQEIFMKGKKYFFVSIDTEREGLEIKNTEFDDYQWLPYDEALELSQTIYQQGKQRITLDVLHTLHHLDLL